MLLAKMPREGLGRLRTANQFFQFEVSDGDAGASCWVWSRPAAHQPIKQCYQSGRLAGAHSFQYSLAKS